MSYVIEKGIPVPPSGAGRSAKYPFSGMAVSDSIRVSAQEASTARRSASAYGKAHNKKFVSRTVEGGVRIWRTA